MKRRKWLSVLLVICLLVGCMSATANAAGTEKKNGKKATKIQTSTKDASPGLWVGGTEVTEANAGNILGDGKVSFNAETNTLTFTDKPTLSGLHGDALIDAQNMDLTIVTPSKTLSLSSGTALYGISVTGGALTVNGKLSLRLDNSSAVACIYTDNGLTVNGDLTLDSYNTDDGFGVKSMGPVTATGTVDILAHETGIYCGSGDVTLATAYFGSDSQATLGFCPASCIYTAAGGVDVDVFGFEFGVAAYLIYANGPVHIGNDLAVENLGGLATGGYGIMSTSGGIVCDGNVNISVGNGHVCLNSCDAPEGITINGNAVLQNAFSSVSLAAISAAGGPITVTGNLKVTGYGETVVAAKGDITVGGYADIKASTYDTSGRCSNAMASTEGSVNVTGYLKASTSGLGVYAYQDITVGGDATVTGSIRTEKEYLLFAENGAVSIGGTLTTNGLAQKAVFGGESITVNGNATVSNAGKDNDDNAIYGVTGMESNGTITFVSGTWDVTAGTTAIFAKDGIVIPAGYGITLPVGGGVAQIDGAYTVTERDGNAPAAHAIISDKAGLDDGYYLIGPNWTVFEIDPAALFNVNPENSNEYMLSTTLETAQEIKVVRVEGGAITAWYPDGEHTQYTVDEAHAGDVTIYFKTSYDSAWAEFGGYFYIAPAPAGHKINVTDYSKGLAVTSLEAETLYNGDVTFTVSAGTADTPCKVGLVGADGSITALACTTADGVHSFTVTVADADVELVIVVKGDVDLDGNLKNMDSTYIKQVMVHNRTLNEETAAVQTFAGDVNGSGKLELMDATMIARSKVGTYTIAW